MKTRADMKAYEASIRAGIMTAVEAREREDMSVACDGQVRNDGHLFRCCCGAMVLAWRHIAEAHDNKLRSGTADSVCLSADA